MMSLSWSWSCRTMMVGVLLGVLILTVPVNTRASFVATPEQDGTGDELGTLSQQAAEAQRVEEKRLGNNKAQWSRKEALMKKRLHGREFAVAEQMNELERCSTRFPQERQHHFEARPRVPLGLGGVLSFLGSNHADRVLSRAKELELSDEQQEEIRVAHRAYRRAEIERKAAMDIARLDLEPLIAQNNPDLSAVESKLREVAKLEIDEKMARLRLRSHFNQVLTTEQLDKQQKLQRGRRIFSHGAAGFLRDRLLRYFQRDGNGGDEEDVEQPNELTRESP